MKPNKQEEIISAALLISQLTDQSAEKRREAVKSLRRIGQALGPIRIKTELIPHLKEQLVNDDDTQVIVTMLDNLGGLGEAMGGGPEHANIFPLLEELMQNEEEKVRVKAVEVYEKLVRDTGIKNCEPKILISLKNILAFEYNEAKQGYFAVVSKLLGSFNPPTQQAFLSQYLSFAESPVLTLRKFAALYSRHLAEWLPDFEAPILKIVEVLFKDKDESNKIYLVDTIITLSKFKNQVFLQAYFNLISYQFPWRVRYELISKVDKLAEVLGSADKFKPFLTYMIKYINDIEPEIRSISCLKLREITPYVEADDVTNKIIPALKTIPQDNNVYVRNSLAKSLLAFCPLVGKKSTSEHILPKFLQLLKDEEIEVQLTMFSHINQICDILGVETLSHSTVPAIAELSQHPKWRVRAASCNLLLYLIRKAGKEFINEKILKQVMDYIRDRANAVRKEGIKLLAQIQVEVGSEFFEKNFMPKIVQISKASSYIQRETFLECIETLCPLLTYEYMTKNISPIIYQNYANDPVENVRLTLCKVLELIYERCVKDKQVIKKTLRTLCEDKDRDVKQMAAKVLKKVTS